jgi:hypothetical protein
MITPPNRTRLGRALSAACICLAVAPPLLAQEDEDPSSESEETTPEADTAGAKDGDAKDGDAKDGGAKDGDAKAEVKAEAAADAPPAQAAAPPDPARDEAVSLVGVERLPGSAYPAPRTRGIEGGSLWLTMHGLQWPYMPEIAGAPAARLGLSGFIWSDVSYAFIDAGLDQDHGDQKRLAVQSRGVLRATPTYSTSSGWFGQGQAELVALGDQLFNSSTGVVGFTDDVWVRIGKWEAFDVTAGRFQGWEIANHYGMGLDLNTLERAGADIQTTSIHPKAAYGLTYFWDRAEGRLGSYALHLYSPALGSLPPNLLRVELLGQFGTGIIGFNALQTNFRPSAILDIGFLKLKGGFEYGKAVPQDQRSEVSMAKNSRNGFGGALQLVFDPYIEGGVAYAKGYETVLGTLTGERDDIASSTVTGISGFVNGRIYGPLILGVGALHSRWENLALDERPGSPTLGQPDIDRQLQFFGAVQYAFWDTFYVKFVGSYADWYHQDRMNPVPFTNKLMGGRLRAMLLF